MLFWVLFGAGLGPSFQLAGAGADVSYREYFFPGTLALILLFTAIFSTISIIEDRREGFLQSVLVAPIPRWTMVLGKVLGGTLLATGQGFLFLALGLTVGLHFSWAGVAAAALLSFVVAFALTSLGFVIAWRMDSTQGFHAIMSVFLLPMWLLSGAFFPTDSGWLSWVMWINPLTYGVAGMAPLAVLGIGHIRRARLDACAPLAIRVAGRDGAICHCDVRCRVLDRRSADHRRPVMTVQVRIWLSLLLTLLLGYTSYSAWRWYERGAQATSSGQPRHLERNRPTGSLSGSELVDTQGQAFDFDSLKGKVWLASFFFSSCPGPCADEPRHRGAAE